MNENFYIAVAKFINGERIAMTFDTLEDADKYYSDFIGDIDHWTLLYHEFSKVTLIHDCAGDGHVG